MVKISVILPVYNVEKYLAESLDSALNQTFDDLEIICINDGSTDNSPSILEEYAKRDSRIKIISQENMGVGAARNVGLNNACGEYVYFLDGDDYLTHDAFDQLIEFAGGRRFDFMIFKISNFYDETGELIDDDYYNMPYLKERVGTESFSYDDISDIALKLCVCPPGILFRNEFLKDIRFPEKLLFEDNVFFTKAIFNASDILFYDEYLYHRRRRLDSTSNQMTMDLLDTIDITNILLELCEEYNHPKHKKELYYRIFNNIYRIFKSVDESQKDEFFEKIKADYMKSRDKWESDEYFKNKLKPKYRHIYKCALKSRNARQFESCVDSYPKKDNIFKRLWKRLHAIIKI